ncbi:hypothetical protein SAMD00023378_3957 [Ralstonia sp. NT80]|uniref:hypothetical protein n=1 Tax=Ralstonia sp. NT80 TaxID=1218247 RepID=UPI00066B6234|nr:hypothetical protein [Ralstonia sp. NT80]GAQ30274.1 hypothetical protein SAMD00023378_3957 [Ralstonia sp. NT80]
MTYDIFIGASATTETARQRSAISAAEILRDIRKSVALINAQAPTEQQLGAGHSCANINGRLTMLGEPVFVNPYLDNVPKMQLTRKVAENLPPGFADEMNAWMADFFGRESKVVHMPGIGFFMGRMAYEQLQEHVL